VVTEGKDFIQHYLCGATAFLNTVSVLEKVQAAARERAGTEMGQVGRFFIG